MVVRTGRLFLLILFSAFLLAGLTACGEEKATPAAMAVRPTWTPTPIPHLIPAGVSGPTSTPVPISTPLSTPDVAPTATPGPDKSVAIQRIDAAGPEPWPTIAPLPPGGGRSPVRILIPAVGLDAAVQPMGWHTVGARSVWDLPDLAAGHHIDSAFPGEMGNVVISGHHNIGGAVFAPISRIGEPGVSLGVGDEIVLEDELGRRFVYRITGWRRIPEANASPSTRQENASYLLSTDFPQLTLITCWPPDSNTHRVIIFAVLTAIH